MGHALITRDLLRQPAALLYVYAPDSGDEAASTLIPAVKRK